MLLVVTFFSHPKPFVGETARRQRNALASWLAFIDEGDILVFGRDTETESAARLGARVAGEVATTDHGTPLVSELFRRAAELSRHDALCYVNADIILPPTFVDALKTMWLALPGAVGVGECRNLVVDEELAGWTQSLARAVEKRGVSRGPGGIDYLAFRRDAFPWMPPFALGRAGFDNWLIWDARSRRLPVVDLTAVVRAVHQDHDYSHLDGGRTAAYAGPEAQRNVTLAGGELHLFNIDDATHRLTPDGLKRNRLAPLRAFPPARWAALRWGEMERFVLRQPVPHLNA